MFTLATVLLSLNVPCQPGFNNILDHGNCEKLESSHSLLGSMEVIQQEPGQWGGGDKIEGWHVFVYIYLYSTGTMLDITWKGCTLICSRIFYLNLANDRALAKLSAKPVLVTND